MSDLHRDVLDRQAELARQRAADEQRQRDDCARRNREAIERLDTEKTSERSTRRTKTRRRRTRAPVTGTCYRKHNEPRRIAAIARRMSMAGRIRVYPARDA